MGDSIAGAEAPPLEAALTASGQRFKDASSDGGGSVVEGDKMPGLDGPGHVQGPEEEPRVVPAGRDRLPAHHLRLGHARAAACRVREARQDRDGRRRRARPRLRAAVQDRRLLPEVRGRDQERARRWPSRSPTRAAARCASSIPRRCGAPSSAGPAGPALQGRHPLLPAGLGRLRQVVHRAARQAGRLHPGRAREVGAGLLDRGQAVRAAQVRLTR